MKKPLIVVLVIVLIMSNTSCANKDIIKKLETNKGELSKKSIALKGETKDLEDTNTVLNNSLKELQDENKNLNKKISELDNRIETLKDSLPKEDLGITLLDFVYAFGLYLYSSNIKVDDDVHKAQGELYKYLLSSTQNNIDDHIRYEIIVDKKTNSFIALSLVINDETDNIENISLTYNDCIQNENFINTYNYLFTTTASVFSMCMGDRPFEFSEEVKQNTVDFMETDVFPDGDAVIRRSVYPKYGTIFIERK